MIKNAALDSLILACEVLLHDSKSFCSTSPLRRVNCSAPPLVCHENVINVLVKDTTSKLANFIVHTIPFALSVKQGNCDYRF